MCVGSLKWREGALHYSRTRRIGLAGPRESAFKARGFEQVRPRPNGVCLPYPSPVSSHSIEFPDYISAPISFSHALINRT